MTKKYIYFLFFLIFLTSSYAINDFNINNCNDYPGSDPTTCEFYQRLSENTNVTQTELMNLFFSNMINPFQTILDWNKKIISLFKTTPTNVTYYTSDQIENAWMKILSVEPTLTINNKEYLAYNKATIITEYDYAINTKKYENTAIPKNQKVCSSKPKIGECRVNKKTSQTTTTLILQNNNKTIGTTKETSFTPQQNNSLEAILTINQNTTYDHYSWSDEQGCKERLYCKTSKDGTKTCESRCYCYYYTCQLDYNEPKNDKVIIKDKINIPRSPSINTQNSLNYSKISIFPIKKYQDCTPINFNSQPIQKTTCKTLEYTVTITDYIFSLFTDALTGSLLIEKPKPKYTYNFYLTINKTNLKELNININNNNITLDLGTLVYSQTLFGKTKATYTEILAIKNGQIYIENSQKINDSLILKMKMTTSAIDICELTFTGFFESKKVACKPKELPNSVLILKTDKNIYSNGENIKLTIKQTLNNKPLTDNVTILYGNQSIITLVESTKTISIPYQSGKNTIIVSNYANIYKGQTTEMIIINEKPGYDLFVLKITIYIALIILTITFGIKFIIKKYFIRK